IAALYEFIRQRGLGVVSTVSENGAPEAALVNIAASPDLHLVFHAIQTTRKCSNLRRDPRVAIVIGWDGEKTLQYEGIADEPGEPELGELKKIYFESCPNATGRAGWPGVTYF